MNTILQDISKSYGENRVLRHVTLELPLGVTCLMGPSGRGKTTLLRILLGLERPDGGRVLHPPTRVSVLFQENRLVESLTVGCNLKLALGAAWDPSRAEGCMAALGMPRSLRLTVRTLSGGMKRRSALARALLFDAPLLALDEPFQGLDEETRRLSAAAVRAEAERRAVLAITHDPRECELLGGRLVRL